VFHPVLAIGVPASLIIYLSLLFFTKLFNKYQAKSNLSLLNQLILLAASFLPILYAFIDQRMQDSQLEIIEFSFILEAFTNWGFVILSALLFTPFFWGLYYFYKKASSRNLFYLSISLFLGTSVSYAIIFSIFKGDSEQILTVLIVCFLIPLGSLGMFAWLNTQYKIKVALTLIFVLACIVSRFLYISDNSTSYIDYCLGFDEEWAVRSTVSECRCLYLF